jgi:hypothetical protein
MPADRPRRLKRPIGIEWAEGRAKVPACLFAVAMEGASADAEEERFGGVTCGDADGVGW